MDVLKNELRRLEEPLMVVSTVVGRGMYSIGEALLELLDSDSQASHVAIEEFLPESAVREDLKRYKWISNRLPILLNLAYRTPLVYQRKLLRERWLRPTDLRSLRGEIVSRGVRSVVCVSHRPAFWVTNLKRSTAMDLNVVGLSGEFGSSPGWKYIFWEAVDLFLSPVEQESLRFGIPPTVRFAKIELPARSEYKQVAAFPGEPMATVVVCGYWGQGPIVKIVSDLTAAHPQLRIHAICGENEELLESMRAGFEAHSNVVSHGLVESLAPILKECGSVITKPGISTLLEARAGDRKIFLLRGMPVAEDHNARFALRNFDASWFSIDCFGSWLRSAVREKAATAGTG